MSTNLFLYTNGDSFVEGCELGDFLLPNYPGARDLDKEDAKAHLWYSQMHTMGTELWKIRNTLSDNIKQEEQRRNFSYKLSQQLGAKFINAGLGGSSNDRILRTTIRDLIELKKTEKNIVAVIGVAEPLRIELPGKGEHVAWQGFHPGNPTDDNVFSEIIHYYYLHTKNYNRLMSFYKHIIFLKDFCRSNGITLLFVSPFDDIDVTTPVEEQFSHEQDLVNFRDYAAYKPAVRMIDVARQINRGVSLPGRHFSEIVHEHTANELLKLI